MAEEAAPPQEASTSLPTVTSLKPNVRNLNVHNVPFPFFGRPSIVGCFSVDGKRRLHLNDRSQLKFVQMSPPIGRHWYKRVHMDLNRGLKYVIRKPPEALTEKLDHILHFILGNLPHLLSARALPLPTSPPLSADIVCFRGLLRLLMCTPYEHQSGWSILASRYRGNIYLCRLETEAERTERERNDQNPHAQRMFSYGFKLEQYLATSQRGAPADTSQPVNEAEEFCCMFQTRLADMRLLYGAEMDGLCDDQEPIDIANVDLNAVQFAEIKANRMAQTDRQAEKFFKQKARNWWAQSFLVGVERIVVGDRTDAGVVVQLYERRTADLARESKQFWSGAVCMEFLVQFLRLVTDTLVGDTSNTSVYRFDYTPNAAGNSAVQVRRLQGAEEEQFGFLPDWYKSGLNERLEALRQQPKK